MRSCRADKIFYSFLWLSLIFNLVFLAGCGAESASQIGSSGPSSEQTFGVGVASTPTQLTINSSDTGSPSTGNVALPSMAATRSVSTATLPPTLSIGVTTVADLPPTAAPAGAKQATTPAVSPKSTKNGSQPRLLFVPRTKILMLGWALLLAENVKPPGTTYQHEPSLVSWQGQGQATEYKSLTDCSGLINALLTQTYGLTTQDYQNWLKTSRPLAITFEINISNHNGFTRIDNINQAQPGDLLAIKYLPGNSDLSDDTGHIMLIKGVPQPRIASPPLVKGTLQWDVPVIDSAQSGHGKEDTRRKADGTFREGLGEGTFRVYSDPQGKLVGYSWSDFADSVFYDQTTRPFTIGRIDPDFTLLS